jgi:flagella basal body P-ring formation protein FlgA
MRWLAVLLLVASAMAGEPAARRTVPSAEFAEAAIACLRADVGETIPQVASVSGPVTIPGEGAYILQAEPLTRARTGRVQVRVRVLLQEREVGRSLVSLHLKTLRPALVTLVPIARGSPIGLEHLQKESVEVLPGRAEPLADPALVVGFLAASDLPAGTILTASSRIRPHVVRPGPVTLIFAQDGFQLSASGVASAAGYLGDVVAVRRGDGQSVQGKVVGPAQVLVNY